MRYFNFYFGVSIFLGLLSGCDFNLQEQSTTFIEQHPLRVTRDGWPKSHPAWSPDGTRIAYSSHQTVSRLFKMAPNGEGQSLFGSIEDFFQFNEFTFSPDGQKLVYYSQRKRGLWLVDFQTNRESLLTEQPFARDPVWSPDGAWIACEAPDPNRIYSSIWIVPATGGPGIVVSSAQTGDSAPSWSPDSREIAYVSWDENNRRTLRVVSIADGQSPDLNIKGIVSNSRPSWSPDGTALAFEGRRNDSTGVWVVPSRGGTAMKLTTEFRSAYQPRWAPGEAKIAFQAYKNNSSGIWTIPAQGGEALSLTKSLLYATNPVWSPDGSQLAFRSSNDEIWIVSANGADLQQTPIRSTNPAWFPNSNLLVAVNEINFSNINIANPEDFTTRAVTDVEDLSEKNDPDWFPNNDKIVFVRRESSFSFSQIWTFALTSGVSVPFIPNFFYSQFNPEISPDGTTVVFDDGNDIYISTVSNAHPINLTAQIQEKLTEPSWSPDGMQLACIGNRNIKIYAIESDHLVERVNIPGIFSHISWSSDNPVFGSHIAVEEDGDIYLLFPAQPNPERIITNASYPDWSPDGTKLAYVFGNEIYVLQIFEELP